MTAEDLKNCRDQLSALPKGPWSLKVGIEPNAVDFSTRIDIYSAEKIKTVAALGLEDRYPQIFHYHGESTAPTARGLKSLAENPKALQTIEWIITAPEREEKMLDFIDALLKASCA